MAKLYFRYGAMNSGKTTHLIQVAYNYEERHMKVLLLKPKVDSKGKDYIVSRIGVKRKVDYMIDNKVNIYDLLKNESMDCLLVDEVQFLTEEQIDQLLEFVTIRNIPVICYGLRTDFQTKGFPGSKRLLLLAHSIEELKTICRCGKKAVFNARKINGEFVFDGNQIAIDGDEVTYESLCHVCYDKEKKAYHQE
ncbi:MAG: thymidine kinase [Bacillota bacterium]|nr:thymidine kinase [Bacillota bacterium]